MNIKFSYPLWGSEHLHLENFFRKIKEAGYSAVEMGIPFNKEYSTKLKHLLKEYDLSLIAQQVIHETGLSANEYAKKMEKYLHQLARFEPEFINSHTGRDFYTFTDNCKLFKVCEDIEDKTGINIYHETHRGRALFCPQFAQQYFKALPNLKITADFSHWCCVSESLLQEQQNFLDEATQRANYIHARIGNEQSPQINHPSAPEHKKAVDAHLSWWKKIIMNARETGKNEFWICTEFGPTPYLQTLPFTNRPVASQFEINLFIKDLIATSLTK